MFEKIYIITYKPSYITLQVHTYNCRTAANRIRTKQTVFQSPSVKAKREYKLTISDGNNSEGCPGYRPHGRRQMP